MCTDVCTDVCADMFTDMCIDTCADMYIDMCTGMYTDMCMDMCVSAVGFDAMKSQGATPAVLLRKGGIGDWKNHLDHQKYVHARLRAFARTCVRVCACSRPCALGCVYLRVHTCRVRARVPCKGGIRSFEGAPPRLTTTY